MPLDIYPPHVYKGHLYPLILHNKSKEKLCKDIKG